MIKKINKKDRERIKTMAAVSALALMMSSAVPFAYAETGGSRSANEMQAEDSMQSGNGREAEELSSENSRSENSRSENSRSENVKNEIFFHRNCGKLINFIHYVYFKLSTTVEN